MVIPYVYFWHKIDRRFLVINSPTVIPKYVI